MTQNPRGIELSKVRRAGRYQILPYEPRLDSEFRLMDMGLCSGVQVEWVRSSPLGDPVFIKVNGVALAVRRQDFGDICVTSVS